MTESGDSRRLTRSRCSIAAHCYPYNDVVRATWAARWDFVMHKGGPQPSHLTHTPHSQQLGQDDGLLDVHTTRT
eukprot:scaffold306426_cov32-Tisochrysis_lutea.AAC.1